MPYPKCSQSSITFSNDFILGVLKYFTYKFNLREKILQELKDSLFWAFHYEEKKNKAHLYEKDTMEPPNTKDIDEILKLLKKYRTG